MTKYRIVTNGYRYRVQKKVFFFFWRTMRYRTFDLFSSSTTLTDFGSQEDAERELGEILERERRKKAKFRPIPSRKLSQIGRLFDEEE
jgi:hypothetical protein